MSISVLMVVRSTTRYMGGASLWITPTGDGQVGNLQGVPGPDVAAAQGASNGAELSAHTGQVNVFGLSQDQTLAFFINIYNALVIHATIVGGSPKTVQAAQRPHDDTPQGWERMKFFNSWSYYIGGYSYTLNDIENGVIRQNRR